MGLWRNFVSFVFYLLFHCLTCNFHWCQQELLVYWCGKRFKSLHSCQLKKDVQLESCELHFICGKMRTAAREAASQIALRVCSKAAVGEDQYIRFWWRGSLIPWDYSFYKRFFVSHEDLMSPWRGLVLL